MAEARHDVQPIDVSSDLPPTAPESAGSALDPEPWSESWRGSAVAVEPGGPGGPGGPTATRRARFGGGGGRSVAGGRRLALIVGVTLVALILQFLVVDRVAVAVAEREMAGQIRRGALADLPCSTTPPTVSDVHIGGVPFLTQVVTGSFQDVGMTMTGLPTAGPRVERVGIDVEGVHVPMWRLATGGDGTIRVDDMRATVRMTYTDLNAYLATQPNHIQVTPVNGGESVRVSATASVPLIGDQRVSGVTTFSVRDNQVTLVPSQISLDGLIHLTIPLGGLGGLLPAIPIPVSQLPFDLTVTSAATDATGLSLAATARNIEMSTADQKPCRPTGTR
ncbi:conserved hypothetical protein [Frankia canadensis]|uniref:DUF2993 domain-containing protein n=1 Tax=Frankia canadensis TaxID=1836972 RepID=A0A2I2KXP5_9ACTN|nr:DUF2993 domain-containing protein [Frankia canadensis]SNQ50438.1 conserved hypothetical protein [Frankia canadensis]SOU57728.1 conserved hypothetical protein [Frankia canadensis]